jgi:uncharacterized membrane protein
MHTIQASIIVDAPAAECYRRWREIEAYPSFMRRVVHARQVPPSELTDAAVERATWSPQRDYADTMTAELVDQVLAEGAEVWAFEVRGPFNRHYHFSAGVVMDQPNKIVSWASAPDQEIATGGSVNFLKLAGDHQTLVEVKMTYSAPLPPFGELVADVSHYGDNVVNECLLDFKRFMEREYGGALTPAERDTGKPVLKSEHDLRKEVGEPETVRG